jgi:hypothetical protein
MSWQTQAWVWSIPTLTAPEKLVALALGNHGDEYGNHIRPGVSRLCNMTGLSESTVKRSIRSLTDTGFLILVRETDGRGTMNEYRMPVDMDQVAAHHKKGFKMVDVLPEKGVTQTEKGSAVNEKGFTVTEKGVQDDPPDSNRDSRTHSRNQESADSRFEEFWAAYPARRTENGTMRKIGKDGARKLYPAALKEIPHDDLMAAVALLAKSTAVEFIPDPERWLKHKRWSDELLPGMGSAESASGGHVNGHSFKIPATAPPDAWAPLAEKMSAAEDGSMHPEVNGSFLDRFAMDICEITGLDPNEPRGDWTVLVEWARAGLCDMKNQPWKEYLLPELRRICARPGYKTPGGLAYFTTALKGNWQ